MDGQILTVVMLVLALAVGALLGWMFGSRPAADLRARLTESEDAARELDGRFRAAIKDLGDASIKLATLEAHATNFEEQKRLLLTAQEGLKKEFENAGAKVLAQAQEAMLARAQERFTQSEEKNEARIKALLEPWVSGWQAMRPKSVSWNRSGLMRLVS